MTPTRSTVSLLSRLPTLAKDGRLQGEDRLTNGGKHKEVDGETALESDNNHRTGASHTLIIIITSNQNNKNINSNGNDNNDTSNNNNSTT